MTSATRAFHVTFTFLCLHGLHDSQYETLQLSTDCPSHSSRLCAKKKKRITEISNIRLRPPCLTSSCRGNGLICAFNNFNQPCECGGSCTEQKSGEAERKKQTEREENI